MCSAQYGVSANDVTCNNIALNLLPKDSCCNRDRTYYNFDCNDFLNRNRCENCFPYIKLLKKIFGGCEENCNVYERPLHCTTGTAKVFCSISL